MDGKYQPNVISDGRTKLTAFGMQGGCYATEGTKTHGANYGWWASSLSVYHYIHQPIWILISTFFSCHTFLTGHVLAPTNHLGSSSQQSLLLFIHS
jgi:hypothetical protein